MYESGLFIVKSLNNGSIEFFYFFLSHRLRVLHFNIGSKSMSPDYGKGLKVAVADISISLSGELHYEKHLWYDIYCYQTVKYLYKTNGLSSTSAMACQLLFNGGFISFLFRNIYPHVRISYFILQSRILGNLVRPHPLILQKGPFCIIGVQNQLLLINNFVDPFKRGLLSIFLVPKA